MSWDKRTRTIKCPCGKGTIEHEIKEDDWNRTEYDIPTIKCDCCNNKFKIVVLASTCPFSWKDHGDAYFLVPKDFKFNSNYQTKYKKICGFEISKESFVSALIVEWPKKLLLDAYNEIVNAKSINSLKGVSKRVAKQRIKYLKSAKVNVLKSEIKEAINGYDSFNGNYDQLSSQEEHNRRENERYREAIQNIGILLDL